MAGRSHAGTWLPSHLRLGGLFGHWDTLQVTAPSHLHPLTLITTLSCQDEVQKPTHCQREPVHSLLCLLACPPPTCCLGKAAQKVMWPPSSTGFPNNNTIIMLLFVPCPSAGLSQSLWAASATDQGSLGALSLGQGRVLAELGASRSKLHKKSISDAPVQSQEYKTDKSS